MPRIRAQFSVNHGGQEIGAGGTAPLRCTYVRHEPLGPTYITDINGVVRDKDGNEGVDSLTTWADVTIHCQNSVARVLDGNDVLQRCPTVPTFRITRPPGGARATGTITTAVPFFRHFRLLNQIFAAYHLVWRQFEPFLSAGDFPLGRSLDLETTRNQQKRIEVLFPSPASAIPGLLTALGISPLPPGTRVLSFTDPVGTPDGWPRIHVEPDPPETRLFTGGAPLPNGNLSGLTLVPSELAHALHFSLLTKSKRDTVRNDYLAFLFTQLVNGLPLTHNIGVLTNPMVAFIEAFDHFSHRLSEHVRASRTTFPNTPPAAGRYVVNELRNRNPTAPRVGRLTIDASGAQRRVEARPATGLALFGTLDEGAIFGGLFLGLALRVGLKEVVEALLESKKLNFGQFRTWFNNNRPNLATELDDIVATWGL